VDFSDVTLEMKLYVQRGDENAEKRLYKSKSLCTKNDSYHCYIFFFNQTTLVSMSWRVYSWIKMRSSLLALYANNNHNILGKHTLVTVYVIKVLN